MAKCRGEHYVHILFGARQTGKSTLLRSLFPDPDLWLDLSDPEDRLRYAAHPGEFVSRCEAIRKGDGPAVVVVDEVQNVPALFDAVQSLYDRDKERWCFVLCGSSARRLRSAGVNLLPGRALLHRLFPLTTMERGFANQAPGSTVPHVVSLPMTESPGQNVFPGSMIEERLAYGELPGIVTAEETLRGRLLKSYSTIHLQEEVRREGMIRDAGAFARFLPLAANEAGGIVNYTAISSEAGVSLPTVKSYYQLLEDMFVGFHVQAFSQSPRKRLLSTPRFHFFDLGVRHAAAGLEPSVQLTRVNPGSLLEQWVAQELWKRLQYLGRGGLYHYRTRGGAEIGFIVELDGQYVPVEVKWTEHPVAGDAREVAKFMAEFPSKVRSGFVICRCREPLQLADGITAIPYDMV